jgi:flagellar hook assembly protein FlgD
MVRVYAISGRMIYERTLDVTTAGYQQIAWNGIDAEGRALANGVYFYRLAADNGVASSRHEGRLVKVTKPKSVPEEQSP